MSVEPSGNPRLNSPSMKPFNEHLQERIETTRSHLCVGLDVNPEKLNISNPSLDDLKKHTKIIIEATRDLTLAYKPNLGFFERWGADGFQWLKEALDQIGAGPIVIGDAKRGDIGNTARQYAHALFDHFNFDAITVNPYMGRESIEPFIERPDKGAFVLCRTSNPSAGELQNQTVGKPLYQRVAEIAVEINTRSNVGLVVGATVPAEIGAVRAIAPGIPFLIPGIGAQGGDLETSMRSGNLNGAAIINLSRAVIFAGDHSSDAIRNAAQSYADEMKKYSPFINQD